MLLFGTDRASPTEAAAHLSSPDGWIPQLSDLLKIILTGLFLVAHFFENGSAKIQILEFHQYRQVKGSVAGRVKTQLHHLP